MSRILRWRGPRRAGVLWFAVLWLAPVDIPLISSAFGPDRPAAAQDFPPQDPGGQDPFGQMPDDSEMPRYPSRSKAARRKARLAEKGASKKGETKAKGDAASPASKAADSGQLKFSQDIAPILVANCSGCHSKDGAGLRRGKLDLTTFEKLQKGSAKHPVIVPGKPEESHLVLRINGEEEPKMPQGNNNTLSADAVAKITRWVKEGARLDAGIDPRAAMDSYAASSDQLRNKQLERMSPEERDKRIVEAGQSRWKQSGSKQKPAVVPGTNFILFSNLPNDRATSMLRAIDGQYNHVRRLLGQPGGKRLEKIGLLVFSSENEFTEFIRTAEGRDVDAKEPRVSAKLNIPQPYIAALDPAGGKKEEPARRRAKGRRSEESEGSGSGSDRSLLGLLTEGLGSGSVAAAGKAPQWLRDGIGLYLARGVEPRSPYYRQLRTNAAQIFDQGWETKAGDALGGKLPVEDQRAVGFALVEFMMNTESAQSFPAFIGAMLEGGQEAIDAALERVYNVNRKQFLDYTGQWVAERYGQAR